MDEKQYIKRGRRLSKFYRRMVKEGKWKDYRKVKRPAIATVTDSSVPYDVED